MSRFSFKIKKKNKKFPLMRAGEIETPHGKILTPAFVVVGTKATVKGVDPTKLKKLGTQTVLANTYHLYLQPGEEAVKQAGGFAKFMNYKGPTWTDSGGFQVLSLGAAFGSGVTKIATDKKIAEERQKNILSQKENTKKQLAIVDEDGVTFKSILDGSSHRFTPEKSVQIQHALGADIFFAFDECTSPLSTYDYQKEAMERTHLWAERSLKEHKRLGKSIATKKQQAIFGVVQGSGHIDLRTKSAEVLGKMNFDGYGIGGSFTKEDIQRDVAAACKVLPEKKPRHLLGIGEPIDFFLGVEAGIDTFDCVIPTRMGRHAQIFTEKGKVNLTKSDYKNLNKKITKDKNDPLYPYTWGYMSHLFRSDEMLGGILASEHNLYFLLKLMSDLRKSILKGNYNSFKKKFLKNFYH